LPFKGERDVKTGKPRRVKPVGFSVAGRLPGNVKKRHANPAMSLSIHLPPKYPNSAAARKFLVLKKPPRPRMLRVR
jgi:hypothetical protein